MGIDRTFMLGKFLDKFVKVQRSRNQIFFFQGTHPPVKYRFRRILGTANPEKSDKQAA